MPQIGTVPASWALGGVLRLWRLLAIMEVEKAGPERKGKIFDDLATRPL